MPMTDSVKTICEKNARAKRVVKGLSHDYKFLEAIVGGAYKGLVFKVRAHGERGYSALQVYGNSKTVSAPTGLYGVSKAGRGKHLATAFVDEVDMLNLLKGISSHLVEYKSFGIDPLPHIITKWIDGSRLDAGALTLEDAMRYVRNVGQALMSMHDIRVDGERQPIAHLDIKPSNVMIDRERDIAVLIDLGNCQPMEKGKLVKVQHPGSILYQSKEQIGGRATLSSDVWAFGVLGMQTCFDYYPFNPYTTRFKSGRDFERHWGSLAAGSRTRNRLRNVVVKNVMACTDKRIAGMKDMIVSRYGQTWHGHYQEEDVSALYDLFSRCMRQKHEERPEISDVVKELELVQNGVKLARTSHPSSYQFEKDSRIIDCLMSELEKERDDHISFGSRQWQTNYRHLYYAVQSMGYLMLLLRDGDENVKYFTMENIIPKLLPVFTEKEVKSVSEVVKGMVGDTRFPHLSGTCSDSDDQDDRTVGCMAKQTLGYLVRIR